MSKRDIGKQLARQERRFTHVRRQRQAGDLSELDKYEASEMDNIPELHHILAHSPGNATDLRKLLRDLHAQDDPAIKVAVPIWIWSMFELTFSFKDDFISQLKDHILSRLYDYDGGERQFTVTERSQLHFPEDLNRVVESKSFRVNYTSYDIRCKQDYMRPGPDCTIMTLSREDSPDSHPFWYARVLHAFTIPFVHVAPDAHNRSPQTIEVLWVRWLGIVPGYTWGFKVARLPKVGFVPEQDDEAFRFLDPSLVIQRCHLIPAFFEGRTDALLRPGKSIARRTGDTDDWSEFYVNMSVFGLNRRAYRQANMSSFADRDMFTRFAGIGVGHMAQYHRSDSDIKISDDKDGDDPNTPLDAVDDCADNVSIAEVEQRDLDADEEGGWDEEEDRSEEEDGESEDKEDEEGCDNDSEKSDEGDFEF